MNLSKLTLTTGIYAITCIPTSKIYVGQSRNIKSRKSQHVSSLLSNKHYNSYLQNAFNKYGRENFSFRVLENCEVEKLTEREAYWINFYRSNDSNNGFNLKEASIHSEPSQEYRESCRTASIKAHQAKGRKYEIVNIFTGEVFPELTKKEAGLNDKTYNYKKGLVVLPKDFTLQNYKEAFEKYNKRNDLPSNAKSFYCLNLTTGGVQEFQSIEGASRELGIPTSLISGVLNGKKLSTSHYTFSHTQEFPDKDKMRKQNVFPVFVLDKDGCRYYNSQYTAATLEFSNDTHASSYIKDFIDTDRSHKGKRFFSQTPSDLDRIQVKYNLTSQELLAYKIIQENKTVKPGDLPGNNKSNRNRTKKKLIEVGLITQCSSTFFLFVN